MRNLNDFHEAYHFISSHPQFMGPMFLEDPSSPMESKIHELCIMVVKVNPNGECIDDDPSMNVKTKVWLEHGPCIFDDVLKIWTPSHDIGLDSGGDTFEQAIIQMAGLVLKHYGDYEPILEE